MFNQIYTEALKVTLNILKVADPLLHCTKIHMCNKKRSSLFLLSLKKSTYKIVDKMLKSKIVSLGIPLYKECRVALLKQFKHCH